MCLTNAKRIELKPGAEPVKVYKILYRYSVDSRNTVPAYATPIQMKNVPLEVIAGKFDFVSGRPWFKENTWTTRIEDGYMHSYSKLHYAVKDYVNYFMRDVRHYESQGRPIPVIFECEIPVDKVSDHYFLGEFEFYEQNACSSKKLRFVREITQSEIRDCVMSKWCSPTDLALYRKYRRKMLRSYRMDSRRMRRYAALTGAEPGESVAQTVLKLIVKPFKAKGGKP